MFLKTISMTGFKSFAAKTVLNLEPGITAVVGPNGSGKSNLADAIRWALGEQSKSRLRLGDREEVVFGGTERRAKASFAEVVLTFDNEDGAFPLDLTEVEISRRLYRSGESEYKLGGKPIRLQDVQTLIAEAGFGAGSYAVIGQGTIDNLLISTPAERKLLFDEAAGIRGVELKREASLRKLSATEANLTRLRDISAELAPRLASLERNLRAVEQRQSLEADLVGLKQSYINRLASDHEEASAELREEAARLEAELKQMEADRGSLERAQAERLARAARAEAKSLELRERSVELEKRRETLQIELAEVRGERLRLEELQAGSARAQKRAGEQKTRLAAATKRLAVIDEDLGNTQAAAKRADGELAKAAREVSEAQSELVALRHETADGTQQQYVGHALAVLQSLARKLQRNEFEADELRLLVHKAGRLLSHATRTGEAELLNKLKSAQARLEVAMSHRETAIEHQTNITINLRSLEIDRGHQRELVERLTLTLAEAHDELEHSREKLGRLGELKRAEATLTKRLEQIGNELSEVRRTEGGTTGAGAAEIAEEAARAERVRGQIAAIQARLNELKIREQEWAVAAARMAERAHEWGVTPDGAAKVRQPAAELEQQILRLEAEIASRRELEAATTTEFAEVSERQAEMVDQVADLEAAKQNLEQLVAELDVSIRERFKSNFAELSKHFSAAFTRLFGGGSASLELDEADGEYGITIRATPHGKRLANLSALSGGERALAGVALLAAILTVNPSPFVVLDEIDAALDEANSGKLAEILAELAAKSQLIVITHNRQTMQSANVLFGVTMDEQLASRLISVHLEQATALAAR